MIRKLFSYTRYVLFIPVLGALLASVAIMLLGGAETVLAVIGTMNGSLLENGVKALLLKYIEIIDLFLIGTVFYITSLGLYELFIDDQIPTPDWLHITHLDDLKAKLLSVTIVILTVIFLGEVINWDHTYSIFGLGAGIAVMILAVTYFLSKGRGAHE
jgi:uncharacterized membrane protein YqhA